MREIIEEDLKNRFEEEDELVEEIDSLCLDD